MTDNGEITVKKDGQRVTGYTLASVMGQLVHPSITQAVPGRLAGLGLFIVSSRRPRGECVKHSCRVYSTVPSALPRLALGPKGKVKKKKKRGRKKLFLLSIASRSQLPQGREGCSCVITSMYHYTRLPYVPALLPALRPLAVLTINAEGLHGTP